MNVKDYRNLSILIFLLFSCGLKAQEKIISIWPGKAPGTENRINNEKLVNERYYNVYRPDLRLFLTSVPDSNKPAILIFAGGGYSHIAIVKEGYKVAKWLNSLGISAFVLKYRLNRREALADAKRAFRLIRNRAEEYNINPDDIGIMGFSAGGHLALNLAIHSDEGQANAKDKIDSASCKPDFMVLMYPQADSLAEKRFLSKKISPTFIVHATDDKTVPVKTSIELFNNLHSIGVPVELHIFEKGGHGFGLGRENTTTVNWPFLCSEWLKATGILK